MPFKNDIGLAFNCGYCRTFVYECLPGNILKTASEGSDGPKESGATKPSEGQVVTTASDGKISGNDQVCPSEEERFRALFVGPHFVVGNAYFDKVGTATISLFERHFYKVKWAFNHGYRSVAPKEEYTSAFSTANWETLPAVEKSRHSLSNCVACATQFEQLQKGFPLKPFFPPPLNEKENMSPKEIADAVLHATGVPLTDLAANLGYKSAAEVKQIVKKTEKKCFHEAQRKCIAEVNSQLKSCALQAVYSSDVSFSKHEKMRKVQFFDPPSEANAPKKKRYALRPHECENHAELCQSLKDWDPAIPFVGTKLAKKFNAKGTDSSHKIKLLAQEENSNIPGLEIVPKRKSKKVKFEGDSRALSIPAPPSKKRLVDIDRSLVSSGVLNEGVPCVPVKLLRYHKGVQVEIVAHSRKFPLNDIRKSLLDAHEPFMRLHSDCEIAKMSKANILDILRCGARYSMKQFEEATLVDLQCALTKFERNRNIWIWHDHSSLASHGILAVMIGVVYDPIVFKTEIEVSQSVQEFVEEGEIHIVAHGSSTLCDQATLIPERLAELDGLTNEITSNSGVKVTDTLRFFKGDKPAAEFEAGVSTGGHYPCVGCACHYDRFADYPHAVTCKQRSLKTIQEMALGGHYGRAPGKLNFYVELSSDQLRMELEKRSVKDYPTNKKGRLAALKGLLCGVHRVPSMLMFAPETSLSEWHLSSYCVLPCEPLHDLKGYLAAVLKKLPSILPSSALNRSISVYLETVWKKTNLYGSDLREALVEVALIFASHSANDTASDFITCLVQVSRILYSKDSDRSPKQCLQFYNCAYMVHELHRALFGEVHTSLYFHALLIHGPVQHEIVCCRSTNTENEERIFKSAESAAMCTDRKPEKMLIPVLKRLQTKRSSKVSNPLQSLRKVNSRIATSAKKLPPFKGTVFTANFVKKRVHSYQAHLQRICHFLVQGEGVWWHTASDGSFHFHDSYDDVDFSHAGPQLLHFRNAQLGDVLRRSNACWQDALKQKTSLPLGAVRHFDSHGDVSEVTSTKEPGVVSESEVSFETSVALTVPNLPPPESSTPVRQTESASVEPLQPPEGYEVVQEVEGCAPEEESVQPMITEGFVDMVIVEEASGTPHSTLQSSVCKAIAKLIGLTPDLQEFDCIRSLCKRQGKQAAPIMLEKHKAFASSFRKLISRHKRGLEHKLAELSHSSDEHSHCVKDIQNSLKLIVTLH